MPIYIYISLNRSIKENVNTKCANTKCANNKMHKHKKRKHKVRKHARISKRLNQNNPRNIFFSASTTAELPYTHRQQCRINSSRKSVNTVLGRPMSSPNVERVALFLPTTTTTATYLNFLPRKSSDRSYLPFQLVATRKINVRDDSNNDV